MTDKQRKRVHVITYSCDDREELAERIVALEDENEKLWKVLQQTADFAIGLGVLADGCFPPRSDGKKYAEETKQSIDCVLKKELGIEVGE